RFLGSARRGAWRGGTGVRRIVSVAIVCSPLGHAACLMRSAARSRAEAARGLPVTSSLSGRSAPLVSRRNCGAAPGAGTGRPGGRVAVDDVGGGALGGPVHPHVQRGVLGVGEATRGVVQLRG